MTPAHLAPIETARLALALMLLIGAGLVLATLARGLGRRRRRS